MGDSLEDRFRLIVREELAAALAASRGGPTHYASDSLPPGVTSRVFVDGCRSGEIVAAKVGKRWVATAAAVDSWIASRRPSQPTPASADGYTRALAIVRGKAGAR